MIEASPEPVTTQVNGESHGNGYAGFSGDEFWETAQQSAPSSEQNSVARDVACQLGRRLLKRVLDGLDDLLQRSGYGGAYLLAAQLDLRSGVR